MFHKATAHSASTEPSKDLPSNAPKPIFDSKNDPFAGLELKYKPLTKKEPEPTGATSQRSTHSTEGEQINFVKADLPPQLAKEDLKNGTLSAKGEEIKDQPPKSSLRSEKAEDNNNLVPIEQKHSRSTGKGKTKEDPTMPSLHQQRKEKDVRAQFAALLREDATKAGPVIEAELAQYGRKCVSLQLEQQSLMVQKREMQRDLDLQHKEIESTTEQLAVLTRDEKYKEAEAVNIRLKKLSDVAQLKEEELAQVQEGINMIEHKLLVIYKAETELLEYMDSEYRKWITEEEESLKISEAQETKRIAEERDELEKRKLEEVKLAGDLGQAHEKLKSKTDALEAEVNKNCQKWIEDKQKVVSEINAIDEEMKELERKIEEKRVVRKGKEEEEKRIQGEIQKVKATFHDQEQEIDAINLEIRSGEEAQKKVADWVAVREDSLQSSSKENQDKLSHRSAVLGNIHDANKATHEKAVQRKLQIQDKESIRDRHEGEYQEWYKLKLKVSNLEKKQEYYEEKAGKSDGQIGELNMQLATTKATLNKMEEEKKAFAAARKFKDAARVANDIKGVQTGVEKTMKTLSELMQERDSWTKEIAEIMKDVEKSRADAQQAEEKLNKTRYRQLRGKVSELESLLATAEEIKSEKEAVEVLKQQIKLCEDEARGMREKWGYLEECEFERLSPDAMMAKWRDIKTELGRLEKEVEALSAKEDYEGAEKKQDVMKGLEERARGLETALKKLGRDVNEKPQEEKKAEAPHMEPVPVPESETKPEEEKHEEKAAEEAPDNKAPPAVIPEAPAVAIESADNSAEVKKEGEEAKGTNQ